MIKKLFHTTSLKANIVANFAGNGWSALIGLLFVPIYLKYIGAEGYGLIGIFASLQVVLSLLDSGFSTTLNKEMSRLSVLPATEQKMRNIVKTLGGVYWLVALAIGAIAVSLSPLLAKYWVQPKELSVQTITYSFILLSISLMFQFPSGFYSGGLLGLQRQIMLNLIRITFATLKSVGAILVLMFVSKSILAFFGWTLLITILQAFTLKFSLWYCLPKAQSKPIFDKQELKNVQRFATGMIGISLTAILLTQIDKIILSKILSLEQFGYYSIAATIGLLIFQVIGPITQSYFPKFSELTSIGDTVKLKYVYHQACQLISVIVLPTTFMLVFFSKELMWIWTQNSTTVNNTWIIVAIFSLGSGLNGLINIPYQLTLAYGWVKLPLYQNSFLLILMIPLTIILTKTYGTTGGALSWIIINSISLFLSPYLLHRKFLKEELKSWWLSDILTPLLVTVFLFLFFKFVFNPFEYIKGRWISLLYLGCMGIFILIITSLFLKKLNINVIKKLE